MHKNRYGKKGTVNPHRGLGTPKGSAQKQRTGQQKQDAKSDSVAGGVGYRIDRYPPKDSAHRRGRYVRELSNV